MSTLFVLLITMNDDLTSNHTLMSMQLLLNQLIPTTPKHPSPPAPTNDRGVCDQTTVAGCAQTTLAALAKQQFGGLERHLCHTLELG